MADTDDTISTDPKMKEECRRAVASSALPKLPFDPKAIARDVWETVIAVPIVTRGFEETWTHLTKHFETLPASSEVFGALNEAEYRQVCASLFHAINGYFYSAKADSEKERAEVHKKASMFAATDRLKLNVGAVRMMPDVLHAIVRSPIAEENATCLLHPFGCPEGDEDGPGMSIGKAIPITGEFARELLETLTKKRPR